MASTIDWPEYLPQIADVSFEIPELRLFSPMEVGPAKVRRRFTYMAIPVSGRLVFQEAQQLLQFLEFYNETLKGGSLSFNWEHPATDVRHEMRFKSVGAITLLKGGHFTKRTWSMSIGLEVLGAA